MAYGHICTNDSMMAGAIELPESECPVCCKITKQRAHYIGVQCLECRRVWDYESNFRGRIVRMRRELLKLNRREMGKLTGYSSKTIKQYEWVWCTKNYYEKTRKIMKARSKR